MEEVNNTSDLTKFDICLAVQLSCSGVVLRASFAAQETLTELGHLTITWFLDGE